MIKRNLVALVIVVVMMFPRIAVNILVVVLKQIYVVEKKADINVVQTPNPVVIVNAVPMILPNV